MRRAHLCGAGASCLPVDETQRFIAFLLSRHDQEFRRVTPLKVDPERVSTA